MIASFFFVMLFFFYLMGNWRRREFNLDERRDFVATGARPLPPTLTAAGAHLFGGHHSNVVAAALLSPT